MDADIKNKVNTCSAFQSFRNKPPPVVLHPWEWPQQPWARLHANYAGPFMGKMFLILIGAHLKLLDAHMGRQQQHRSALTYKLRSTYAILGCPEVFSDQQQDNISSADFETFCTQNILSSWLDTKSPYYAPMVLRSMPCRPSNSI